MAFAQVPPDRSRPFVREDMLDKAAGGDVGVMPVRKVVDLPHPRAGHQGERAAGITPTSHRPFPGYRTDTGSPSQRSRGLGFPSARAAAVWLRVDCGG